MENIFAEKFSKNLAKLNFFQIQNFFSYFTFWLIVVFFLELYQKCKQTNLHVNSHKKKSDLKKGKYLRNKNSIF